MEGTAGWRDDTHVRGPKIGLERDEGKSRLRERRTIEDKLHNDSNHGYFNVL